MDQARIGRGGQGRPAEFMHRHFKVQIIEKKKKKSLYVAAYTVGTVHTMILHLFLASHGIIVHSTLHTTSPE